MIHAVYAELNYHLIGLKVFLQNLLSLSTSDIIFSSHHGQSIFILIFLYLMKIINIRYMSDSNRGDLALKVNRKKVVTYFFPLWRIRYTRNIVHIFL